jgi:hypothetical protein
MASPGPWSKRPDDKDETQSNIIKGPWSRARGTGKAPAPVKAPKPRRGREPIINNWGLLVVFLLLWFVLPPLASWLVHLLAQILHAPV